MPAAVPAPGPMVPNPAALDSLGARRKDPASVDAQMSNAASFSNGPEPPGSLGPESRIEGEFAVRAILRSLMARQALVSLYPEGRADATFVARIVHVDENGVEFEACDAAQDAAALLGARFAVGVSFPEDVKTQFTLDALSPIGRSARPDASDHLPAALHAPLPPEAYRLQRRDAFRVCPPAEDEAHCVQRLEAGAELRHPLIDLSAGGLSIRLAPGSTAPAPGQIWRHSRIEAAGDLVIPCELMVRGLYRDAAPDGAPRVAFEFHAMPAEALRRVQVYVIDIEKRSRRNDDRSASATTACS